MGQRPREKPFSYSYSYSYSYVRPPLEQKQAFIRAHKAQRCSNLLDIKKSVAQRSAQPRSQYRSNAAVWLWSRRRGKRGGRATCIRPTHERSNHSQTRQFVRPLPQSPAPIMRCPVAESARQATGNTRAESQADLSKNRLVSLRVHCHVLSFSRFLYT
jgi:hypothetical protein